MGAYEYGDPPFVGDLTEDAHVNWMDLFRFQLIWKQALGLFPFLFDQNGDHQIDSRDLIILEHAWGNEYP
jgi:hypothetical protein